MSVMFKSSFNWSIISRIRFWEKGNVNRLNVGWNSLVMRILNKTHSLRKSWIIYHNLQVMSVISSNSINILVNLWIFINSQGMVRVSPMVCRVNSGFKPILPWYVEWYVLIEPWYLHHNSTFIYLGGGRTQVDKYFWPGEITQQIYHWQILPIIF